MTSYYFTHKNFDLVKITDKQFKIEPSLKFTREIKTINSLPFFDILLMKNSEKLEFKVSCKTTSKNDQIIFYSHYNTNTKRGIITGFYLRVLRNCSPKYLHDEFDRIENSFLNFLYPKTFIQFAKSKALKIHKRKQYKTTINTPPNII